MLVLSSLVFFTALVSAKPLGLRQDDCDTYTVPNVPGGFTTHRFIDFSTATPGQNTQEVLANQGLFISDYTVPDEMFIPHTFVPENVALVDGALSLKVSEYSGSGNVISAEIFTEENILYASVRTVLKSSTTRGVVEGFFFYKDQQGEIDLEILTETALQGSPKVEPGWWTTNHNLTQGDEKVSTVHRFNFDPSADFHEYRIDWSPTPATHYYVDGEYMGNLTQLVPDFVGSWLWNVWSNGDDGFSAGPPTADSITLIQSIEIYMDYTANPTGTICPV
ncbi:hypothetical protein NMY22_g16001 [Coprinellus aureogranulatus]|nr:hypothetical protein NMY22_g16001 [Coprinellus aureogranulatus]